MAVIAVRRARRGRIRLIATGPGSRRSLWGANREIVWYWSSPWIRGQPARGGMPNFSWMTSLTGARPVVVAPRRSERSECWGDRTGGH